MPSSIAQPFDERGRLFVVEMLDYPIYDKSKPPQGRIKMLEDKDGDGRYETATVFADNLLMAQGVQPWRGGILVTQAPNVLFLKDTDGDGKADVRETLYSGFAVENPQLRVSFPTFGLDNWIYVASGASSGGIIKGPHCAGEVHLGNTGFRFKPGQFGWLTLWASPFRITGHPFSFSSSAEAPDGRVDMTIRNLGDFGDLEFRNPGKETAGLLAYALRVLKMARIVIGHAQPERMAGGLRFKLAQNLGDVLAFCGEGGSARGPCGVVAEQVAVFLHGGSAAGGVDDDGVDLGVVQRNARRVRDAACNPARARPSPS